jgi:uncharacterized membrane protein
MFGLPLHPSLIHFPIALVVVGAVAEAVYIGIRRPWLRFFGPILLTCALLGATAAYFTGTAAGDVAEHQGVPQKALDQHEQAGVIAFSAIGLAALLSWATRARDRGLQISATVAILAAGITLYTAHLGGRLVFVHGAGHVTQAGAGGAAGAVGSAPADAAVGHEAGEHSAGDHH